MTYSNPAMILSNYYKKVYIFISLSWQHCSRWNACASLCGWRYVPPLRTFTD